MNIAAEGLAIKSKPLRPISGNHEFYFCNKLHTLPYNTFLYSCLRAQN